MLDRMRFVTSTILFALVGAGAAHAGTLGQPSPGEMSFQPPATTMMNRIEAFHFGVLIVCTAIMALVAVLLIYVMIRFNARANPRPSKVTHNTVLEVAWTIIPGIVLVGIGWA